MSEPSFFSLPFRLSPSLCCRARPDLALPELTHPPRHATAPHPPRRRASPASALPDLATGLIHCSTRASPDSLSSPSPWLPASTSPPLHEFIVSPEQRISGGSDHSRGPAWEDDGARANGVWNGGRRRCVGVWGCGMAADAARRPERTAAARQEWTAVAGRDPARADSSRGRPMAGIVQHGLVTGMFL